jgi:hypothetical protein
MHNFAKIDKDLVVDIMSETNGEMDVRSDVVPTSGTLLQSKECLECS